MKTIVLSLVVALMALTLVGTSHAARPAHAGKPAPSGTIAVAAGSELFLGGTVTFDWTVQDIGGNDPRIQVQCFQNGVLVYGEAQPALGHSFSLGGFASEWLTVGGPADCVATLYYWNWHPAMTFVPLAEAAFSAGG